MEKQKQSRLGGLEKVLIGCAIGCGILIVLGIVAGGFGAYWVFSPGKQVATAGIAGEDSVATVHMTELTDDPGAQELLTKALVTFHEMNQRRQQEDLPPALSWMSSFQQTPSAQDFKMYIPREMTLTLERSPYGEDPNFVVAANLRTMIRPFKGMMGLAARAEEADEDFHSSYRGHDVYRMDEDAYLGFVDNTLLFSDAAEALETAIDRLESGRTGGPGSFPVTVDLQAPEGDWDAAGVVHNEGGLLGELVDDLLAGDAEAGPHPTLASAERLQLRFGIDLVSADEARAQTVLECEDAQQAVELMMEMDRRYDRLVAQAAGDGLVLEVVSRVRGSEVVTDLRLTGIEAAVDELVADLEAEMEGY